MLSLWAPVGAVMALLYILSDQVAIPVVVRGWDKLMHGGAYLILGILALRAFHGGLDWLGSRPTILALVLTLSYALLDELHQARVPSRVASLGDLLADAVGACLAVLVVGFTLAWRARCPGPGAGRPER